MNAIDYIADGQSVQFSKKAVTINGEEFAYIGMSAIKHSAAKKIYLFKYEDKWHKLSYNEEDAQKIKTLFSRIAELNAKRAAHAAAEAKPVETPAPAKLDVKSIMEHRDEVVLEPVDTKAEEIASIAEAIESGAEETVQKVVETPVEVAAPAEEPVAEVTEEAADYESYKDFPHRTLLRGLPVYNMRSSVSVLPLHQLYASYRFLPHIQPQLWFRIMRR